MWICKQNTKHYTKPPMKSSKQLIIGRRVSLYLYALEYRNTMLKLDEIYETALAYFRNAILNANSKSPHKLDSSLKSPHFTNAKMYHR